MKGSKLKQKKSSLGSMGAFWARKKESDETLEQKECQTKPEKLWPTKKLTDHKTCISDTAIPQVCKETKHSSTAWLISITSLSAT